MTSGYYCAIFPLCGGGKKKDDKKTKAFYNWATTGIPVKNTMEQPAVKKSAFLLNHRTN